MAEGPQLTLGSSNPIGVSVRDVLSFRDSYPQIGRDGRLNWIVAGGGAVQFLLDADRVECKIVKDKHLRDGRYHKDLEIILFGHEDLAGMHRRPLEIYWTSNFSPIQEIDYESQFPSFPFFVEITKDYYWGFMPPTTNDVAKVEIDGISFYVASPEYIVVSKLFNTHGIREGNDNEDAIRLLRKFELNKEEILRLTHLTPFKFITMEDIQNLEDRVKNHKHQNDIAGRVKRTYCKSGVVLDGLSYNGLVSLLDYEPRSLRDDQKTHFSQFSEADFIREHAASGASRADSIDAPLNLRYLLRNLSQGLVEKTYDELIMGYHRSSKDPTSIIRALCADVFDMKVGFVSELNKVLTDFRDYIKKGYVGREDWLKEREIDSRVLNLTKFIVGSPYKYVHVANYGNIFRKLKSGKELTEIEDADFRGF